MTKVNEMVWLNGQICAATDVIWSLDDRGLSLGDGLFETLQIRNGAARLFASHWQRLQASAYALGFGELGASEPASNAIAQCAKLRGITHGSARILLSRGAGPRGLGFNAEMQTQMLIRVFAPSPPSNQPLRLALSTVRRHLSNPSCQHKTISHIDMLLSRQMQHEGATGNESLLLDTRGKVSSAGCGNLFWIKGRNIYTPSLGCAILPGTTRARVLEFASELGFFIYEGAYWPAVLATSEAVFISNAILGLRAIHVVDLGGGNVSTYPQNHPVLLRLQQFEQAMDSANL